MRYFTTFGSAQVDLKKFDPLRDRQVAGEVRGLGRPHKDERGHVVWNQGFARELPDCIQNGSAESLGAVGRIGLQALFNAFQTEFQVVNLGLFALAFHHSARDQKKNRALLQNYGGRVRRGVGKKAKGQARGREFDNAGVVTEESRSMPCVGIAESAKSLVIATNECRSGERPPRLP